MVVDDLNCESCHGEFSRGFSIHGNLRNRDRVLRVCHNPDQTDVGRRSRDPEAVAAGDQTAAIDFKVMIHKIHTGEELKQKPYLIYGFGPARRRTSPRTTSPRCCTPATGHLRDVPRRRHVPAAALPRQGAGSGHRPPRSGDGHQVMDGREGPIGAVCTSCHDGDDARHMRRRDGASGAEACAVCHDEGRDLPGLGGARG